MFIIAAGVCSVRFGSGCWRPWLVRPACHLFIVLGDQLVDETAHFLVVDSFVCSRDGGESEVQLLKSLFELGRYTLQEPLKLFFGHLLVVVQEFQVLQP